MSNEAQISFDPKKDHEHKWKFKWEQTVRECELCGLRQWRLACWTNSAYTKAPAQIHAARPDLKKKIEGAHIWSDKPHLIRSLDIIPPHILSEKITLVGAGSIGSFTALALYKMGFEHIDVYDPDRVKPENLGTQLLGNHWAIRPDNDEYCKKSKALSFALSNQGNLISRQGDAHQPIKSHTTAFKDQKPNSVVISAVDSMAARKDIWENVKKNKKTDWFIDGRMGAEFALLYTMNPFNEKDVVAYEKTLHTDENSVEEPCTARATVYTAFLIAGMIAKTVKDVLTEKSYARVMHWNIKEHHQQIWKGTP